MNVESLQELLAPLLPGLMGMKITRAEPELVEATMLVRPDLCTTGGILHGGAHMAFADTIGAVATFINLPEGKGTTTIESSTKFLGSAKVGGTVTAECTPLHKGRTTMVWQTAIRNADGK